MRDAVHSFSGDWGIGMGTLSVFINEYETEVLVPVLTVPLNLDATLKLNDGCVGGPRGLGPALLTQLVSVQACLGRVYFCDRRFCFPSA